VGDGGGRRGWECDQAALAVSSCTFSGRPSRVSDHQLPGDLNQSLVDFPLGLLSGFPGNEQHLLM